MPIRGKALRPSGFATIQVFVDELNNDAFRGRVYHIATSRLESFSGIFDFLRKVEQFYDEYAFPQATHEYRSFGKVSKPVGVSFSNDDNSNAEEHKDVNGKDNEIKIEPSAKGTFIIKVLYRQNATWQGNIQWVEGKKTQYFRSDLEMLKLIDEAIRGSDEDDTAKWE
jgi:cytochrome c1